MPGESGSYTMPGESGSYTMHRVDSFTPCLGSLVPTPVPGESGSYTMPGESGSFTCLHPNRLWFRHDHGRCFYWDDDGSVLTLTVAEAVVFYMNMVGIEQLQIVDGGPEVFAVLCQPVNAGRGGLDHRRGRDRRRGDGAGDASEHARGRQP